MPDSNNNRSLEISHASDIVKGYTVATTPDQSTLPLSPMMSQSKFELFRRSIQINKIVSIGAGYVGGPTMAMIAAKCPEIEVHVVDISQERIDRWNSDKLPIYEPGLDEIVQKCRGRNLFFSTEVAECIKSCDIIFISVNTPTKEFGVGKGMAADLSAWELAARNIAANAVSSKIVVEKSTVPVRTADSLYRVLKSNSKNKNIRFAILSNPEFLAEGTAIKDLENPDRVLVGGQEDTPIGRFAMQCLVNIYKRWVPENKILTTNVWASELSKLAQRLSSINTVSTLCEKTGVDIRQVAKAIGADSRIGPHFLNASVGYGGSCLQKDVLSLSYLCDFYGLHDAAQYWRMVKEMNDLQKRRFTQRIIHGLFNTVNKKKIAIFGFAFKKNTADTRATPAVDVCCALMDEGARLHIYDPRVEDSVARREFAQLGDSKYSSFNLKEQFFMEATPEAAVKNAHAIVILTDWDEFRTYDYSKFLKMMLKPAFIFDGRNLLDHDKLADIGFEVHGVGVPIKHAGIRSHGIEESQ